MACEARAIVGDRGRFAGKAAGAGEEARCRARGLECERAASIEQKGQVGRKKRELPPLRSSGATDLLGLGAAGLTPGGINLNLSPRTATAAIGQDQLVRERRADGERRKSQHAGRFRPLGIERWRSSIENYVASVKPGTCRGSP